jgi:hypothetical protein
VIAAHGVDGDPHYEMCFRDRGTVAAIIASERTPILRR